MALEVDRPLATCVHVVIDGSRALVYDARQVDEDVCNMEGFLQHDPTEAIRWSTFLVRYGPTWEGIEFSTSGPAPPAHMPLGQMAQLCPFAQECDYADELVRPVTPPADSALLGGPSFGAWGHSVPGVSNASGQVEQYDAEGSSEDGQNHAYANAGGATLNDFRIILDTGCGDNIVSWDFANRSAQPVHVLPPSEGKYFQGVGAVTMCNAKLEFGLDEFEETCEFWICSNSPALASVGRRCIE